MPKLEYTYTLKWDDGKEIIRVLSDEEYKKFFRVSKIKVKEDEPEKPRRVKI